MFKTLSSYFGKKNITLRSVKPPAMFPLNILQEKKRCALLQEMAQQRLIYCLVENVKVEVYTVQK